MKRIGILGGGQLGSLLAHSIYRQGGDVVVYEPDTKAPGLRMTANGINAGWTDSSSLQRFFELCDVVTYEFENVESTALFQFEASHTIHPNLQVLTTTQDRELEKNFLAKNALPHVDFAVVAALDELPAAVESFGLPCILKSARGGYDGKGQNFLATQADVQKVLGAHGDQRQQRTAERYILERVVDIGLEVSCIVARSQAAEEICFPVFENVHSAHILDLTIVPARIEKGLSQEIKQIALETARKLGVIGLLTVEFFLTRVRGQNAHGTAFGGWHIFINELAPRPHNSGHVTMKACTLSQFDVLARILLGIPLSQPELIAPGSFCMANLLGDIWQNQQCADLDLSSLSAEKHVIDLVLYGKHSARAKRKMGHIITHADTAEAAVSAAQQFRRRLHKVTQER